MIQSATVSLPALLAAAVLLASCAGTDRLRDANGLVRVSPAGAEASATEPSGETGQPAGADALSDGGVGGGIHPAWVGAAAASGAAVQAAAGGGTEGGHRVSLRPIDNIAADDLLDHWGHRRIIPLSDLLLEVPEPGEDASGFRELLETARRTGPADFAPGLDGEDAVTVLSRHRGLTYGRWTGGPADTLSIEFDLEYATKERREDHAFRAVLDRAGKVWSRRIDDTWEAWERRAGESKGWLIGDYGANSREIRVAPEGETSTGLVIYVTDPDLSDNEAGRGGPQSFRPGSDWEPHTGVVALDRDHIEGAGAAQLFATMVHEIGHVLGAWYGLDTLGRYWLHVDPDAGTWTGPRVVSVYDGPAPFQDADDAYTWHDGEHNTDGHRFDFLHSGVCRSVMAYCRSGAAIPAFLPAEIDFAFLSDIGLSILPQTDRPETYGLAGWMDHSAFTLSVSRDLDVSLADPQPRYFDNGAPWTSLDTVDFLWAEADAFGRRSSGSLANSFPLTGTVRYAGGLIGAAVGRAGLPPVQGDANLSIRLASLTGKASFTSLEVLSGGERQLFGDGSLHYPIAVADNTIRDDAPGASLMAGFYGPRHDEVAGTLDDPRAGLIASFGARHDDRPDYRDVVAGADHVGGMMLGSSSGIGDGAYGWHRLRCGDEGSTCQNQHHRWGSGSEWQDVTPTDDLSARERVLALTAGWGDGLSEDLLFDHGTIRIVRRHAGITDGRRGRYGEDGYFGTMKHTAFGVGFHKYDNWAGDDGELRSSYAQGAGFQGDLSGTRPTGNAVWEGHMVGRQSGVALGEDPFVEGHARVSVSLSRGEVDIGFTGVTSMDRERSLMDFGFDAIPLGSDGTFFGYDQGPVEGGFFGPAHQEVAGTFNDNVSSVLGSFGGTQLADDVTLGESGSATLNWNGSRYDFERWGYWAEQFKDTVFGAYIDQTVRDGVREAPSDHILGTPAGTNPVSGSATYSGGVRGFESFWKATDILYAAVEGKARLEFDFEDSTVDVDFTDFERGHADMSWRNIPVHGGTFRGTEGTTADPFSDGTTIKGAFYGMDHQGIAGTFDRDRLEGVFGATKVEEFRHGKKVK